MRSGFAFIGLAMQIASQSEPPQILQIHREAVKPGREAEYRAIEEGSARMAMELGCPHPYLAIESLTGSREVWFFNGYRSTAEQKQVVDDYARNTRLLAALAPNSRRKASLTLEPVNVFANYRKDLSAGIPWIVGQGRFLVITVTKGDRRVTGTVFETGDGTRFIVMPARTREDADAAAAIAGPESNVYAVRPSWSFPSREWIAADPLFWRPGSPSTRD